MPSKSPNEDLYHHHHFFTIMEDLLFEKLWAMLYEHGASEKKKEGTQRYWATLTSDQQQQVFTAIRRKLEEGRFVQYDPIRAIKENIRNHRALEPTNYNGRSLQSGTQYVIAKYKGAYGTYRIEDARTFEIKQVLAE